MTLLDALLPTPTLSSLKMSNTTEKRPVKVANCSGYHGKYLWLIFHISLSSKNVLNLVEHEIGDPALEMYRQATLGDVDFITGDYLAGR